MAEAQHVPGRRGRPPVLGSETDHYWLVQRMAKAVGVDLVQAMDSGLLDQADWAGIVTRCRGCQWVDGCDRWLDTPTEDTRALPARCENRSQLEHVRKKLEEF